MQSTATRMPKAGSASWGMTRKFRRVTLRLGFQNCTTIVRRVLETVRVISSQDDVVEFLGVKST